MTVAHDEGERWEYADGAPEGPSFDVEVASSRKGHGPYRVLRDPVSRCVIHRPVCEAWEHGHRNCRHVKRGVALSEDPGMTLAHDIKALWAGIDFAGDDWRTFSVAVYRAAEEAIKAHEALEFYRQWEAEMVARASWTEDEVKAHQAAAVEDFS